VVRQDDPIEAIVAEALELSGVRFTREGKGYSEPPLDFHLPQVDAYIEVCQFWTPRKVEQLKGREDVILVQGRAAALAFEWLLLGRV